MDDPVTGKATTDYLIKYHGNVITWKSRLQRTVSTSTTHAEFTAVYDASIDIFF